MVFVHLPGDLKNYFLDYLQLEHFQRFYHSGVCVSFLLTSTFCRFIVLWFLMSSEMFSDQVALLYQY